MVEGYRILKNRLIHDDVICPQDADAAHVAFWERIQQLEGAHKANVHQELRTDYTERGHRCEWRVAYEAVQQRSKAALLKENDNG